MHIVGKNKAVSLLLVVAMVIGMIPFGAVAAFAAAANISATSELVAQGGTDQSLGSITITPGDQQLNATVKVTVEFPKDKVVSAGTSSIAVTKFVGSSGTDGGTVTAETDTVSGNFKATATVSTDADKIVLKPEVDIKSDATGDINVSVSVVREKNGIEQWSVPATSVKVASVATGKVTATADTAPTIGEGTSAIAKVTIKETVPGSLGASDKITLELPSTSFEWVSAGTLAGLAVDGSVSGQKLVLVKAAGDTRTMTDATIKVFPGAPSGDVKVKVTGSTGSKVEATELVVAKIGTAAVTASVKDETDVTEMFLAENTQTIETIVLKSDNAIPGDKSIVMTLNTGTWAGGTLPTELESQGTFKDSSGKSAWWIKVKANNTAKEITMSGLKVSIPADATVGDLKVTLSGSLGLTGDLVVNKVVSRVNATADKKNVKAGLAQTAGDITISETVKKSLTTGDIVLTLPAGVKFSGKPSYKINTGTATEVTPSDSNSKITIPLSGMSDTATDTIAITGIMYDVDALVPAGDIKVSLSGSALNKIDATKAVASVANAAVVSATAKAAVFVIGQSSFTTDGTSVTMDVAPFIQGSRTFVPVRFVAQALGVSEGNIIWDGVKKTVTLIKGDRVVQMTIGSKTMLINGAAVTMDVAPQIVAPGRTMLPVRFVAQGLGATVGWDAATKTVTLNTP